MGGEAVDENCDVNEAACSGVFVAPTLHATVLHSEIS